MRLLLLGCSGFVGRELVPFLLELGHSIVLLSRRAQPFPHLLGERFAAMQLDPTDAATWQRSELLQALAEADGVVNLAGEPIAEKRWSVSQRQLLLDSRLSTTNWLVQAMAGLRRPPAVLVNASAVGYYGTSLEKRFAESSPTGADFLADVCRQWEAAADRAPAGCRVVKLRIGIVLGPDGGALAKMLPVFRAGFGGPIGSGRQWMSWIHRHDLCRLIGAALEDGGFRGVYNAVAPEPATMASFAAALGKVLGRPSLLPVPGPILQLLLGDGAQVVLQGQRVVSERLQLQGFSFHYPELNAALVAATSPAPH
ncbi:TIGR01777 family oxidoreductase [Synechococcus sp. CS-1328]|uniref:TIGR01777 family oxidoreductase n=1 Tax=Synechococcus sp. CS-1328 TaxID=2847976 RepID=UPI00223C125E|nr:TIGR01777 family oxidoreductase [Synechococcus sp. CS-1328]MCT0224637.1 TIGR01777 family oxidoreductase [Synechococcus sp. CS-1328]